MGPRVLGLVLVLGLLVPRAVRADARAEARAHFDRGLVLFRAADYAPARAEFEAAYRTMPDARVLANVAACFAAEGRPVAALRVYRRVLAETAASAPTRRLAEREAARLRNQVGEIALAVEPAGAEVLVDGEPVGRAPLPWPVAAAPGSRLVEVRAPGRRPVSRLVQVDRASQLTASIVLQPLHPAEAQPPPPEVDVQPARSAAAPPAGLETAIVERAPVDRSVPIGRGPLLWTGVALTLGLATAGAVTGALALDHKRQYEDADTSLARRRQLVDETRGWALATDVLLDAAVVVGLGTIVLYVLGGRRAEDERAALARGRAWLAF